MRESRRSRITWKQTLASLTLLLAGSALAAAAATAAAVPPKLTPEFDYGLSALEAGRPVPMTHRPQPLRPSLQDRLSGAPSEPDALRAPAPEYVEPSEFGVILEYDGSRAELEAAGIRVNTQVGRVFTARVRRDEVGALRRLPGVRSARLARYLQPHLNVSAVDVRANLEHAAVGTPPVYQGRAGRGLIVGDVDSGIDFTRPDFMDSLGQTRILYIWDQTDAGGPAPSGYTYGSEWTKTQIDNTPGSVRQVDDNGHGTAVAGVLIGNGSQTGCSQPAYRYVGMAPLAQFVEVKTDFSDQGIIDGVSYIFQKAAALGKDAVVNLSLGGHFGPHDGSDVFSSSISSLTGPGKIVVASAGNDQLDSIHGKLITTSLTVGVDRFAVKVPSYTKNAGTFNDYFVVTGWYDPSASFTIRLKGPLAADTLSVGMNSSRDRSTTSGKIFVANQDALYGFNGTSKGNQFEVEVYDSIATSAPRAGSWEIDVVPNSAADIGRRVDIWIYASQLGPVTSATVTTGVDATTLVGGPADGDSVFAVAAHATKASWYSCLQGGTCSYTSPPAVNAIASFSNHGPRRDGVLKPEISAPGFGVATTHSSQAGAIGTCGDVDDGVHEVEAGTSFSAPHVAGAAALFLESNPGASPSRVKQAFQAHARADAYTGAVPNTTWGYGKLDIYATFDHVAPAVTVTSPAGGESWPAGSAQTITWTATDAVGVTAVDLAYSTDGGATYPIVIATGLANTGSHPWTVPGTLTATARVRATAHDAAGNSGTGASAANFSITNLDGTPPLVALTSPAGGESWLAGSLQSVVWTASDDVGVTAIDLAYSTDGGATYPNAIATGLANTGSHPWTLPGTATTGARVRVTAHDAAGNSATAASAADFAITDGTPPTVAVLTPTAAEVVQAGTLYDVTFTSSDDVGVTGHDVEYSTDDGANWTPVAAGVPASPYAWTVPVVPTVQGRIRVTAHDAGGNTGAAVSDAFTVADTQAPLVHVLSPDGGESWLEGAGQSITWSATDNVGVDSVRIDYSLHGAGGPWLAVAAELANSGSFAWTVPVGASDSVLVRVSALDPALNPGGDASDSLFQIYSLISVAAAGRTAFALAAPAPNPTRGGAQLRFRLPEAGEVTVEIVGIKGEIVWRQRLGRLPAGDHGVAWDGTGAGGRAAAAGLYFVRVTSPFGARTAKLLRMP